MDTEVEFIAVSDTDPQNENEYFDNKEEAIEYAKEMDLDRVIRVDYTDDTEEEIWTRD